MEQPRQQESANGQTSSNLQPPGQASSRLSDSHIPVADGFRPVSPLSPTASPTPESFRPNLRRSLSESLSPDRIQTIEANRRSIRKSRDDVDIDGIASGSNVSQGVDTNATRFARPSSTASSAANFDRSQSSPYLARVSTFSFSYPRRPPSAASHIRPAHPYALYQQTTYEESDDDGADPNRQTITIGFPGHVPAPTFQRRLGANGEELDIVGPDGHAEQLPPYSRYPMESFGQKPSQTTISTVSPVSRAAGDPTSPVSPVSPIMGPQVPFSHAANMAAPNPVLGMGQPSPQPRSPTIHEISPLEIETNVESSASSLANEKPRGKKSWRDRNNKKVLCGTIPLWAVLLFAVLCVFLAVVAGGVIGGLLSSTRDRRNRTPVVTVTSQASMWDASPIAAPTGVPPLPSGTFFFPLGPAEEAQRSCLAPTLETNAWSCSLPNGYLNIEFGQAGNYPIAKIYPPPGNNGTLYGPQPPRVQPMQKLIWVSDLQEPHRGPALHFQTVYDKIVIIQPEKFPVHELRKRSPEHERDVDRNGKLDRGEEEDAETARGLRNGTGRSRHANDPPRVRYANSPGEEPWYCYWNATFIEGFIYIQQPVPGAETQQLFHALSLTPTPTDPNPPTASIQSNIQAAVPTKASTMTSQNPFQPATLVPRAPGKSTSTSTVGRSSDTSLPSSLPSSTTPPTRFPYIIKMEERRLPNPAFHPFCQRMKVLPDGSVVPKLDERGNKIIEKLKEAPSGKEDAQITAGLSGQGSGHKRKEYVPAEGSTGHKRFVVRDPGFSINAELKQLTKRREEPGNSCHCQWVSPLG